jgi:hypothetical protein
MLVAPVVFVSSTKIDLEEYRLAIRDYLPRFDLLFRGMEIFGARHEAPRDVMLGELHGSDLLVGILGHSYGSRDRATGLSYSQLEYRTAVELGLPVRMFAMADEHPRPHRSQTTEDQVSLASFKAELKLAHVLERFTTPEDLVLKLAHSLKDFLAEKEGARLEILSALNLPDASDLRNIHLLYTSDEKAVLSACKALATSGGRQALEHFYGVARSTSSAAVRDAVFSAMVHVPKSCLRIEQILKEFLLDEENPALRRHAAETARQRARPPEAMMGLELALALISRAKATVEPDPSVRDEVAHALPKIAARRPDMFLVCKETLENVHRDDPEDQVRKRADLSLRDMDAAPRNTFRITKSHRPLDE